MYFFKEDLEELDENWRKEYEDKINKIYKILIDVESIIYNIICLKLSMIEVDYGNDFKFRFFNIYILIKYDDLSLY